MVVGTGVPVLYMGFKNKFDIFNKKKILNVVQFSIQILQKNIESEPQII